VLNKIEIWPSEVYNRDLARLMDAESDVDGGLKEMLAEAFAHIDGESVSMQGNESMSREEVLV